MPSDIDTARCQLQKTEISKIEASTMEHPHGNPTATAKSTCSAK
jgi:hypothetical protein